MIRVGVTGGIGSGKTTLCRVWEELGARVVYADDLAKTLMVQDESVKNKLKEKFGKETYHPDGSLNKPYLIREAFRKDRVEELNSIVHPAVAEEFQNISDKAEKNGERMVVEEAALLLNYGRPDGLEIIVLVLVPKQAQLDRVMQRDNTRENDVLARIEKQPDFNQLTHLADYIVVNDGTEEEFRDKARKLYKDILREFNSK